MDDNVKLKFEQEFPGWRRQQRHLLALIERNYLGSIEDDDTKVTLPAWMLWFLVALAKTAKLPEGRPLLTRRQKAMAKRRSRRDAGQAKHADMLAYAAELVERGVSKEKAAKDTTERFPRLSHHTFLKLMPSGRTKKTPTG